MSLRILSGFYKNRAIKMKKEGVRPTLATMRKRIFDILEIDEEDTFLDVFAGSGIMGMEALSRGAKRAIFFDINPRNLKTIEENLKNMEKIPGSFSCIKTNSLRPPKGSPVNIIFCDPPYLNGKILPDVVAKLHKYNWIGPKTVVVAETHEKQIYDLGKCWQLLKTVKQGISLVNFYILTSHVLDSTL